MWPLGRTLGSPDLGYMCMFVILYLFFMNPCIHPCARIFPSGYMLMISNESKQSRLIVFEKISTIPSDKKRLILFCAFSSVPAII